MITTPAPSIAHQRTVGLLYQKMIVHNNSHQLGELFFAPVDVIFDRENVYQPDLVFISSYNSSIIKENGILGTPKYPTPNLIVEVISPSSSYIDRYSKKSKYEEFGVQEYWIVDPANKTLEIFAKTTSRQYELFFFMPMEGRVKSTVLSGLDFELSDIFIK